MTPITKKQKAEILQEVLKKTKKNYAEAVTANERKEAEEVISEIS